MRHARSVGLGVAVVTVTSGFASAQSLNVDFDWPLGGGAGVPSAAYGAAANQAGVWNGVGFTLANPGPFALVNLAGAPTGVLISQQGATGSLNYFNNITTGDFDRLIDDALFAQGPYSITFSGLQPGQYTVYTYGISPTGSGGSERNAITIAGAGMPATQSVGGPTPSNTFTAGLTHSIHTLTVNQSGLLTIQCQNLASGNAFVGGIQLVFTEIPAATLTGPAEGSCVCNTVTVTGSATGITLYVVDRAPDDTGPWTAISSSTAPVQGGTLATWNTVGLADGTYILRLRAFGAMQGQVTTRWNTVTVDRTPPEAEFGDPPAFGVVGGLVTVSGRATDLCLREYRIGAALTGSGSLTPIDPSTPVYTRAVEGGALGVWDTRAFAADGLHDVLLSVLDVCGRETARLRRVSVDNTAPVVALDVPGSGSPLCPPVMVNGLVNDEHLAQWVLEAQGPGNGGWQAIASGGSPVSGTLASWSPTTPGTHLLRLRARDAAVVDGVADSGNRSEVLRAVTIGIAGDINGDGIVDGADLSLVIARFGRVCN